MAQSPVSHRGDCAAPQQIVDGFGPRVAVCLVGFARTRHLERELGFRAFGDLIGDSSADYHAFIEAPSQPFEIEQPSVHNPPVRGGALCAALLARCFRSCSHRLVAYDPREYRNRTRGQCLVQHGIYVGAHIYPLRVMSYLAQISRCLDRVRIEHARAAYSWILVTRLDKLALGQWANASHSNSTFHGQPIGQPPPQHRRATTNRARTSSGMWARLNATADVVARRCSSNKCTLEDQFFVGRAPVMLKAFGDVDDAYARMGNAQRSTHLVPEHFLGAQFKQRASPGTRISSVPRHFPHVLDEHKHKKVVAGVCNKHACHDKSSLTFVARLLEQLGISDAQRAREVEAHQHHGYKQLRCAALLSSAELDAALVTVRNASSLQRQNNGSLLSEIPR
jgi:hypothetical protein